MKFVHVYNEDCFKGLEKNGFINKNTGFKIQNVFSVPEKRLFNNIAAKDGELYNLIKDGNFPFYVDRIAGGITYFPYRYDKSLLREYSSLLGDWFLGVQLHETNNRRQNDWPLITRLLKHKGPYDVEQMKKLLKSDYAVTPDGTRLYSLAHDPVEVYASLRYAEEPEEYFSEVRDMYKRRLSDTDGHILPCDGCQLFTHLQNELDLGLALLLHQRTNHEGRAEVGGDTVVDGGELSLGRVEVQHALALEVLQLHALVEVHIVHHDEVVLGQRTASLVLHHGNGGVLAHQQVLGEEHTHRGTAREVGTHGDGTIHRLGERLALEIEHHVETLEDIHVELVNLLLLITVSQDRLVHISNHILLYHNKRE